MLIQRRKVGQLNQADGNRVVGTQVFGSRVVGSQVVGTHVGNCHLGLLKRINSKFQWRIMI